MTYAADLPTDDRPDIIAYEPGELARGLVANNLRLIYGFIERNRNKVHKAFRGDDTERDRRLLEALERAANKYDPNAGTRFSTFAFGAFAFALMQAARRKREIRLDAVVAVMMPSPHVFDGPHPADVASTIAPKLLAKLTRWEREAIEEKYKLAEPPEPSLWGYSLDDFNRPKLVKRAIRKMGKAVGSVVY